MNLKKTLKKLKLSEQTISMVLGALVVVVIGVLLFNYFRGVEQTPLKPEEVTPSPSETRLIEEEGKLVPEGLPTKHKVKRGENLWQVAEKYYGSGYNWVDIAQGNKMVNPNLILDGQEITIPRVAVREPIQETAFGEVISGSSYQVQKGDHLWGVAVRAYGDGYRWTEIAKANNLDNPNIIHEGNVLILPR